MKAEPTELDREAAKLFRHEPGMRAWSAYCSGRVVNANPCELRGEGYHEQNAQIIAIDTDDAGTVGAMLAQLDERADVSIVDRRYSLPGEDVRRFMAFADFADGHQTFATGPTRGAALVALARQML